MTIFKFNGINEILTKYSYHTFRFVKGSTYYWAIIWIQAPGLLRSYHVEIHFNKDFKTWYLIGLQDSQQAIRSHVKTFLLTNMDFNMTFI